MLMSRALVGISDQTDSFAENGLRQLRGTEYGFTPACQCNMIQGVEEGRGRPTVALERVRRVVIQCRAARRVASCSLPSSWLMTLSTWRVSAGCQPSGGSISTLLAALASCSTQTAWVRSAPARMQCVL